MIPTRFFALLLALFTALSLSSCGRTASPSSMVDSGVPQSQPDLLEPVPFGSDPEPDPVRTVRIPYDADDSLNPFTCAGLQNYYAAGLLYDTLVALDVMGAPQNRLAQEITIEEGRWVVRLRTDAYFSDNTRVTAQDVAYSATVAGNYPRFAAQLSGVAEVQTPDRYTAVFVLSAPDQYFSRGLTFPIVKEGTAGELIYTDEGRLFSVQEAETLPVGGGRFLLDSDGVTLTRNSRYHTPVKNVRTVQLVDAGDLTAQSGAILTGQLDLMYSQMQGTVDLSLGNVSRQVMLSNLVFLGLNSQRQNFSAQLRTSLSALIDREAVARRAYLGFAAAAYSPIKQSFETATGGEENPAPDTQEAQLDALGYDQRDEEGWRTINGQRFTLGLLVNSDSSQRQSAANIVADAFSAAGIELVIESVSFNEYAQRIAEGNYDLYLGELRVPPNLDLSTLIAPHPTVGPGCVRDQELLDIYNGVKAGKADLSELDTAFRRSMPFIPLVYRRGMVAFSRDFSANIVATEQDIFYNIRDW